MLKSQPFVIVVCVLLAICVFVVIQLLIIRQNGTPVTTPDIPRQTQTLGKGKQLSYVVLGDSTAVGQGAAYKQSYAVASAEHLAANHMVAFTNVAVSGATIGDVVASQLQTAASKQPDIVLLAVGANDATHFTSGTTIQRHLQTIVDKIRAANCDAKIVVTRSPAMDAVDRFPWPAKQLMGLRTKQVNQAFEPIIQKNDLVIAPIAEKTRAAFIADPSLFAQDKFHPNARGYELWKPIINRALDDALALPEQC